MKLHQGCDFKTQEHKSQETQNSEKKKQTKPRKEEEKFTTNFVLTLCCPTSSTAIMFKHSLHNKQLMRKSLGRRRKGLQRICQNTLAL